MSFRAKFWLSLSFVLLMDVVLLLLSPAVGIVFLVLIVLAIALLILFKPERWEEARIRIHRKKAPIAGQGANKTSRIMVLERCDGGSKDSIIIDHSPFEIGRSLDCDYVVENMPSVGRHHCRIIFKESTNNYYIEDLGSRNGTFVNSLRLVANTPQLLKSGSMISLHKFQFIFKPQTHKTS